jgi:MoxR-like ATPase
MHATLTYRQTVELIRRLNGGTVGFDYGRFKLADLRAMLAAAIADGTYDAEQCDAVAEQIAQEAAAPAQPFAATSLPRLGAAKPAPQPLPPVMVPASVVAQMPVIEAQPLPLPVDFPLPQPATPAEAPTPAAPAPQPTLPPGDPCAPARMPLSMAFPKVKLPPLAFNDTAVYSHADAPAVDPHYQFDAEALAVALVCVESGLPMNMFAHGAPGTGKTEFARQFAARTGRAFYCVQFDRNLERAEFLGSMALANGATCWQDGIMLQAFRTPGALLLLDELDYAQQGNIATLNGLIDPNKREYRIADTGEMVRAAPGVFIMGTANTNLTGDATGLYVGTSPINPALSDRFAMFVRFDYLNKAQEARVLRDRTGINKDAAEAIANLLHVCRQRAEAGNLPQAPSLRQAVAMALALKAGIPAPAAYETAVCGRAVAEAREELRNLFAAHWPQGLLPAFAACV